VLIIPAAHDEEEEQEALERRRRRREKHEREKRERNGKVERSSSATNRKGFMPNTPGAGDEPPAPRGNYVTQRDKPSAAPGAGDGGNISGEPGRAGFAFKFGSTGDPESIFHKFLREQGMDAWDGEYIFKDFSGFGAGPDPVRKPREKATPTPERLSTPYATHGGEKLNPFQNYDGYDSRHDAYDSRR
jgi:hypothetical protein